jgi:hypothetical protein
MSSSFAVYRVVTYALFHTAVLHVSLNVAVLAIAGWCVVDPLLVLDITDTFPHLNRCVPVGKLVIVVEHLVYSLVPKTYVLPRNPFKNQFVTEAKHLCCIQNILIWLRPLASFLRRVA